MTVNMTVNKNEMIKKMKREKRKNNLTAMLKTVKRRKAQDLLAEATSELVEINKVLESTPIDFNVPELDMKDASVLLASAEESMLSPDKSLVHDVMMPKRFNPEVIKDWEHELELTAPFDE